ncbi:UBA domain-containing protein mud1-like [Ananas comosus]|uniref:UBA domain-containing protein mud1-like n=1 Tax=Ananas comosus TaxID=4615 RepID=A0A6P5EDR1_ANACO|nr:UBA domain-containing protein mud1-like [Ananas comosus]
MARRQPEVTRRAPSGRVFAAQAEEPAEAEEGNVVAGMVLVNGIRFRAMFDTGATHSFISRSFAEMRGIEVQLSGSTWRVDAPERSFIIRKECLACPVQVGSWIMPTRLLVLKRLKDFDLILGMDWLLKYYASIDCKSKVITFRESG